MTDTVVVFGSGFSIAYNFVFLNALSHFHWLPPSVLNNLFFSMRHFESRRLSDAKSSMLALSCCSTCSSYMLATVYVNNASESNIGLSIPKNGRVHIVTRYIEVTAS